MHLSMYLVFLPFSFALECSQRNISCQDIKTPNGFKFKFNHPLKGSEIFIFDNQTVIAYAGFQSVNYSSEVIRMDNDSITTRGCRDLQIKCIIPDGQFVKETCMNYFTDKMKNLIPSDSPAQWFLITVAVIACIAICICICICICIVCVCKRKSKIDQKESEVEDTSVIELDPWGTAENSIEQVATHESVNIHSADPEADGNPLQAFSLDHNLSDEGIQPSENGGTRAFDLHRAPDHRNMHRNLRDDPGGVNDNKGGDILRIKEMCHEWTPGDPEDDETKDPLLVDQRSAIQGYDKTCNAAVLVDKRSFDQDQFSRRSTAPDADVECGVDPNMSQHIIY